MRDKSGSAPGEGQPSPLDELKLAPGRGGRSRPSPPHKSLDEHNLSIRTPSPGPQNGESTFHDDSKDVLISAFGLHGTLPRPQRGALDLRCSASSQPPLVAASSHASSTHALRHLPLRWRVELYTAMLLLGAERGLTTWTAPVRAACCPRAAPTRCSRLMTGDMMPRGTMHGQCGNEVGATAWTC